MFRPCAFLVHAPCQLDFRPPPLSFLRFYRLFSIRLYHFPNFLHTTRLKRAFVQSSTLSAGKLNCSLTSAFKEGRDEREGAPCQLSRLG